MATVPISNPIAVNGAAVGISVPTTGTIIWLFSLAGVSVPTDVAIYMTALIGCFLHAVAVYIMVHSKDAAVVAAVQVLDGGNSGISNVANNGTVALGLPNGTTGS